MLGPQPFQAYQRAPFASTCGKPAVSASRTPLQNHLLAALPPHDYQRLLPDLEPVSLPVGWTVHRAGGRENYLYFVTDGIISRHYVTEDGASTESAITGNEGVIGVALVLGGHSTLSQAKVLSAGYAYRLRAEVVENEIRHGPLLPLLLRYTQALIAQIGQTAACSRHHALEQRLCCWIMSCLDRLPSNELTITQELIAHMLGVRREGITAVTGKLQKAGLIHCSRGHIAMLDRPRLESRACECYAVVRREYERLFPVRRQDGTRSAVMVDAYRRTRQFS